jgi:hypothetical protein
MKLIYYFDLYYTLLAPSPVSYSLYVSFNICKLYQSILELSIPCIKYSSLLAISTRGSGFEFHLG